MNRLFIGIAALMLIGGTAFADHHEGDGKMHKHKCTLGVSAGFGIVNTDAPLGASATNFVFGGFYKTGLGSGFGFRPELTFTTSAGETFNIPLIFTYTIRTGTIFKPWFGLGPDAQLTLSPGGGNTFSVSIDGAAGFDVKLKDAGITLGAMFRYMFGVTDLAAGIKNRTAHILGTVGFAL